MSGFIAIPVTFHDRFVISDGLHVIPGAGLVALDTVSRTRLSSSLVVRYMTLCSYKEQTAMTRSSFPILR
jgi:hypothetical protein